MAVDSKNPFLKRSPTYGRFIGACDAQSRLDMIPDFNEAQLRQVISMVGVQKTVVTAAQRQLKKLIKNKT